MHIYLDGRSISHPRRGGFKTYIENLVAALANAPGEHRFTIIYDRQFSFPPIAGNSRFREVVIPARVKMIGQLWREQISLPLYTQRCSADLWHFPYNVSPMVGIKNYVLTLHDVTPFTHAAMPDWSHPARTAKELLLYYYPRLLMRRSAQRARAIITVSRYARQQIMEKLRVSGDKVFSIPLAAPPLFRPLSPDERQFAQEGVSKEYGLRKPFLLTVASSLLKNPQGVVEAYSRLSGRLRENCDLVIVMAYGRAQAAVAELTQRSGVADHVHFLVALTPEKLLWLYNLAAALISPSFTESFGLPTAEAMACGTPVLCSATTGSPEQVGDAALLVEPTDVDQIAAAITEVLTKPSLATELAVRGLARSKQFSWEQTAHQTLAVYEAVAKR